MKTFATKAVITAAFIGVASFANATTLPAVDESYVGNYDISNAFGNHGLWLPKFLGDKTWSVTSGTANYDGTSLVMTGSVENKKGGTTYTMDFNFQVFETAVKPDEPYCGNGQACQAATDEQKDNIVYFDMNGGSSMGTVTGTGLLDGLVMDIEMKPLEFPDDYKPGQLGYGGNWTTLDFGYSNWLNWTVIKNDSGVKTGAAGYGDMNYDFLANDDPVTQNPPPVPLPAGLPLLVAGLGALTFLRRRKTA
ncbi:MAG: VPLPA-CTERM sorting domain-containing protein [Pseudomonadota bacterium]